MTDAGFVIAAYVVIIGGLALYTVLLWRRLRAVRGRGRRGAMTVSAPPEPILPPPRRPWGILVLVAVVLVVIGYLAFSSVGNALVYYLTPTELLARGEAAVGETVRLGGLVEDGSVAGPATDLTFVVTDGESRVEVHSTVAPTRSFREGSGAVVEGSLRRRWRVRGNPGDREARRELRGPGVRRAALGQLVHPRRMIPSIGHASVLVGLGLTAYAAVAYFLVARGGDPRLAISARRAVIGSFLAAAVGCAAMIVSLLTHDFSVRYVAENNATTTPPFISVISLWAALEGSILFWALLATGWATLVLHRYRERHRHLMPWVGAVLATVNAFFFAVMTWPGNPFALTSPAGTEGAGPNALLQNHPFMALHPPLLYLGYTGMAIPFAFGIAALATRRLDEEWLRIVRRWTLIPWTFLTLGIVAGAWWSYEVLGWGGYWAWDPVENAALLPWLTATAFVHSAMVAERRGGLRIWTSALVIATFVLTLVGTFLTRSGRRGQRALLHAVGDRALVPGRDPRRAGGLAHPAGLAPARAGRR